MTNRNSLLLSLVMAIASAPTMAAVARVESEAELDALLSTHKTTLLYFTVEDCRPCARASVVIERYGTRATAMPIIELDLEANDLGKRYGVVVAPAIVIVAGGVALETPYYITSTQVLAAKLAAFEGALSTRAKHPTEHDTRYSRSSREE